MEDGSFINIMNQNAFNNIDINDIPKGKNYDLILMEKDKEIINLSNANASLRNQIEQFQKVLKEKDMEINSLKSDMSTLNSDQKLKEEENNILKNRINDLSSEIVQRKKEIEAISAKNNGNNKKLY
jgi:chromosome segregation ATPase